MTLRNYFSKKFAKSRKTANFAFELVNNTLKP